jgi:hypothetical protein
MAQNIHPDFSRDLPAEADALRWGLYVVDYGLADVVPGSDYPQSLAKHSPTYQFTRDAGRTLQEDQLVYISEGRGILESAPHWSL